MLTALSSKSNTISLRLCICNLVGDLAGTVLEASEWPEIVSYSQETILSQIPEDREIGLILLGLLANSHIEVLINGSSLSALLGILQRSLCDEELNGKIIVAAIKAVSYLLNTLSLESDIDKFKPIVGSVMGGLRLSVDRVMNNQWQEEIAIEYCQAMVDIADDCGVFFQEHLAGVLDGALSTAENGNCVAAIRHMMIEFIVSLCTTLYKSVRKLRISEITTGSSTNGSSTSTNINGENPFVARFFPLCAKMMCRLVEDSQWEQAVTAEEEEFQGDENWREYEVAEMAIDRVSSALGVMLYTIHRLSK